MKEHKGLKNLYQEVISGKFNLGRFSLLNSIMDHCLFHVYGDILEIGLGETTIYTTKLAEKYNRRVYHCDYSISLIENMYCTNGYFCENSIVYKGKSNEFFKNIKLTPLSVVFIDGSHLYEDVKSDFYNSLKYLVKDGIIILHDTLPPDKSWTIESKCGTVYKFRREIEGDNFLDVFTFPFSAFNVGLSIIRKRGNREWEL